LEVAADAFGMIGDWRLRIGDSVERSGRVRRIIAKAMIVVRLDTRDWGLEIGDWRKLQRKWVLGFGWA
jgi:hypothetical protein